MKQNTERDSNVNRAFEDFNYFECHVLQFYYKKKCRPGRQDNSRRPKRGFRQRI